MLRTAGLWDIAIETNQAMVNFAVTDKALAARIDQEKAAHSYQNLNILAPPLGHELDATNTHSDQPI